jgi:hypothetical protein
MRSAIQILGPLTTVIGIVFSVWGTYLVTRSYHTFSFRELLRFTVEVALRFLRGKPNMARKEIRVVAQFADLNPEVLERSLAGLCFLLWGFLWQGLGAILWGIDMVWGVADKCH